MFLFLIMSKLTVTCVLWCSQSESMESVENEELTNQNSSECTIRKRAIRLCSICPITGFDNIKCVYIDMIVLCLAIMVLN